MLTMFFQTKTAVAIKMMASLVPSGIPLFLAQAGIIGQDTGLSLVVVGSVVGGAWYLSSRLTKLELEMKALKEEHRISSDKVKDTAAALAVVTTATAAALAASTAAAQAAAVTLEKHMRK